MTTDGTRRSGRGTRTGAGPVTRETAADDGGDVVVFLIGMRLNRLRSPRSWVPVTRAMPAMLRELGARPGLGLLDARAYLSGRVLLVVQYWRSYDQLEAYARSGDSLHLPAWRRYDQALRASGAAGVFHETYVVPAGGRETVYVQMPAFGLGRALGTVPVGPGRESSRERVAAGVAGPSGPVGPAGGVSPSGRGGR
jgi:hypothetical protein